MVRAKSSCRKEMQKSKAGVKEASERHSYKSREPGIAGGHLERGPGPGSEPPEQESISVL